MPTDIVGDEAKRIDTKIRKANKKIKRAAALGLTEEDVQALPPLLPSAPASEPAPAVNDPACEYFDQAQQAVIVARLGGQAGAMRAVREEELSKDAKKSLPELSDEDLSSPVGRSLFIAVYAREQPGLDGSPILKDVGYDALYFVDDPNEAGSCIEITDREHWL